MSADGEMYMASGQDPKDRRLVGGYEWRDAVENAQQICLDLLVEEKLSVEARRKISRLHAKLSDLARMKETRP